MYIERERRKGRTNQRVRNLSLLRDYRLSVPVVRPLPIFSSLPSFISQERKERMRGREKDS